MSVVNLFQQIAQNDFGFFQQVKSVSDVMTANPASLTLDDTFSDAVQLMKKHRVAHAPVINPDGGELVGVVSDRDLLRFQPRLLGKAAEGDNDHKALKNAVTKFMTRNPVCCNTNATPVEAMTLMLEHHIDSVIVSDDGRTVAGIVTPANFIQTLLLYHRVCTRDYSLKRLRLVDLDLKNGIPLDEIFSRGAQTVRDVMTKDVLSINPTDHLSSAVELMREHEIRHLPVISKSGTLAGLVSDRDVLKCLPVPDQKPENAGGEFRDVLFATDDKASQHLLIESLMDTAPKSVSPDTLLTDALALFEAGRISGVPVCDHETGAICGMLTTSDILRVFRVVMQIGWLSNPEVQATASTPAVMASV